MVKISNNYKQNSQFDYSYEYEYNINGNRTKVTSYDETESIVSEDNYTYSTIYKDRLESVSHNNTSLYTFSYQNDNFLNPSSITRGSNTYSLTWEGRRLVGINYTTYSYNEDGIRIKKENANEEVRYYIGSDNKVLRSNYHSFLNTDNYIIDYHYDESGTLVGLHYDGKEYFYKKDILGIINEIIDEEGTSFVYYKYTAFGIPTLSINTSLSQASQIVANILLDHNIYIYKDYIYDQDTSLYYLNSRYYDPHIGRFISIDAIEYLDIEIVNGLNLYAYCMNNPVMYSDPEGNMALLLAAIAGILASGLFVGFANATTKSEEESFWGSFLGGFVEGSISALSLSIGLAVATGTGGVGLVILGGAISAVGGFIGGKYGNAVSQKISYGNVDWGIANINGFFSMISNVGLYLTLFANIDFLPNAKNLSQRILLNSKVSFIVFAMTSYFLSLPKMATNKDRDEERIKSRRGRFIWDYLY